jgi:hypothetical protein
MACVSLPNDLLALSLSCALSPTAGVSHFAQNGRAPEKGNNDRLLPKKRMHTRDYSTFHCVPALCQQLCLFLLHGDRLTLCPRPR